MSSDQSDHNRPVASNGTVVARVARVAPRLRITSVKLPGKLPAWSASEGIRVLLR